MSNIAGRITVKNYLALLTLSFFLVPQAATNAAPRPQAPASSPAQVQWIMDRVVDNVARQRDLYWHRGDYPRIIALDRILTQADPHFLDCYETGAWLMESMGDRKDAEAYYRQGVANNPRTSEPYYHLGFFYFNTLKDYRRAANTFKQGTAQPNADINDWRMLAHSYTKAREYDQALAAWQHIKARWPRAVAVDHNLAEAQAAASGATPAP